MAYNGSVELISGLKQKNNGTFPLVDASAVRVDDETRLDAALRGCEGDIDEIKSALSESTRKLKISARGPSQGAGDFWLPMKTGDKLYIKNNTTGTITAQLLTMKPRTLVQNFGNIAAGTSAEVTANVEGTHISFWLSSLVTAGGEIIVDSVQTVLNDKIEALYQTVTDERNNAIKTTKIQYAQIEDEDEGEEEYHIPASVTRIDDHTIETNNNFSGFETFPKKSYSDGKSVLITGHLKFTSASIRVLLYWSETNTTGFTGTLYADLGHITNPNGAGNEYELDYKKIYTDTAGTMSSMSFVGIGIQNLQASGDTTAYRISASDFMLACIDPSSADFYASSYYAKKFPEMMANIVDKIDEETEIQNVDYAHVQNDANKTNYETSHSVSGSGTISGNTATITETNSGIQTNRLQYEGDDILYRIRATVTHNAKVMRVLVFGYDAMSGGGWKAYSSIYTGEQNPTYENKEENIDITFDPANFAVYQGYSIFNICYQLQGLNPETNVATEIITVASITKEYPYESLEHYDLEFTKLFTKLSSAVSRNTTAIENMAGGSSEAKTVDPDGNKYALRVGANGSLIAVPHIPNKVIFIGNSFLLGQTFYGMCATDPEYDWYHLTMDAVLNKNPSAIAYRCPGAWFEQLGTSGNWQTSWNNQTVRFQMDAESSLSWNAIFDDTIDLVVIQLGDNADGTDDRLTAYNANLDGFCHKITTLCPKARLLFLGSSARYTHTKDVTEAVVKKYGMGLIVIQDLRQYSDFNGVPGQTYLLPDGTRAETPAAWLSHAGNGGHQHIADAVLEWMDM